MSLTSVEIAKASVSTLAFTTTFFKNPSDKSKAWNPNSFQKTIYDTIDYGYDVQKKVIEPVNSVETVLISCPRQQGKTEGIATAAGALAIRFPGSEIGVMSNNNKNAKKLIRRIKTHIINSGMEDFIHRDNSETIEFENGSIIDCYGNTENIRSNSYTWLIVDEAAQFDENVLVGAAMPTTRMAGAFRKWGTPSIILLSTPRGTSGVFGDMFMKGLSERQLGCRRCNKIYDKGLFEDCGINWFDFWVTLDVPNDKLSPCPKCGATDYEYVDQYYSIVRSNPYEIFSKEYVDRELAARGGTPLARQELLGEFIGSGQNVFKREWLEMCTNYQLTNAYLPKDGIKYYMGVDFGKTHDKTVFCVVHEKDRKILIDWIDIINGKGLEYVDIRAKLIEHISNWKPLWVIPDATGLGDPVCEQMEKDIQKLRTTGLNIETGKQPKVVYKNFPRIKNLHTKVYSNKKDHYGFIFDMNTKPDLVDNLQTIMSHGELEIPRESIYKVKILWEELINFGYDYTSAGRIKYGVQNGHDDTVIALALACWGVREKPFINVKPKVGGKDGFIYNTNSTVQASRQEFQNYSLGFGFRKSKRFR